MKKEKTGKKQQTKKKKTKQNKKIHINKNQYHSSILPLTKHKRTNKNETIIPTREQEKIGKQ